MVPLAAEVLIPIPRPHLRRLRYGVDPGLELAKEVSRRTGLPVLGLLEATWWRPPQAGKQKMVRGEVVFRGRAPAPAGAVIVDDVVTTGGTLWIAWEAVGRPPLGALTATSAGV
jgi:predicted amidophosphoribosyltransferase